MSFYHTHFRLNIFLRRVLPCLVALACQVAAHPAPINFIHYGVSLFVCFFQATIFGMIGNSIVRSVDVTSERARIILSTIFAWTTLYALLVGRQWFNHIATSPGELIAPLVLPAVAVCILDNLLKLHDGNEKMLVVGIAPRTNRTITHFVGPASKHYINLLLLIFPASLVFLKCIFVFGKLDSYGPWLYLVALAWLIAFTFFILKLLMGKGKLAQMRDEVVTLPEDYYRTEFL